MVSCGFWTLVKLQSEIKQKFAHNAGTKTSLSGNAQPGHTAIPHLTTNQDPVRSGISWLARQSDKVLHKSTFIKHYKNQQAILDLF